MVDEHDRFLPGGFTRRLGAALGVAVLEFQGIDRVETFGGRFLAEMLRVDAAEVLETFADGTGAFTRNGTAYYLPDADGKDEVVRRLTEAAGIEPVLAGLPPRVEACARGDVTTVINHSPEAVGVARGSGGPGSGGLAPGAAGATAAQAVVASCRATSASSAVRCSAVSAVTTSTPSRPCGRRQKPAS